MAHLNSTRRSISYADPTGKGDPPDVTTDIKSVIDALDNDVIWLTPSTAATRPATPIVGSMHLATDTGVISLYTGVTFGWLTVYPQAPADPGIPIGATIEWDYLPTDAAVSAAYLMPFGQAISRVTYATLNTKASNAGYPQGAGNGTTTFNIADKRGRVSVGKDDMGGTVANRITAAISGTAGTVLGAVVGSEGVTLTTATIPVHNHTVTGAPGISDPSHTHVAHAGTTGGVIRSIVSMSNNDNGDSSSAAIDAAVTGITVNVGSLGTANNGSGGAHLNVQPAIIVNKLLRVL